MAIKSYKDKLTLAVAAGKCPKGFPADIFPIARRKLGYLASAGALSDLSVPVGNKLHPLKGDRSGQHAIWINDQFRICFRWSETGCEDVEIVDYH